MPAHVWSLPPPHNRSTANDAGNAPKLRTGVFRGKCDSDVPRLFTGPTETTPSTARSFRVVPRRRWRASLAGVAGEAPQKDRQFQLSQLKRPTPPPTENSAQRTANGGGSRAREQTTDKPPPIPQRQHHPATPRNPDSKTPGGGIEPPRRQPAPGTSNTPTPPQTDLETR